MEQLSKAKAKWIRSLKDRKTREEERVFVVEGKKMVQEALHAGWDLQLVAYNRVDLLPAGVKCPVFSVSNVDLDSITALDQPEGILAVLSYPDHTHVSRAQDLHNAPKGKAFWLDGIQDPGNLGTLIRIADWFGFTALVCGPGTADCFNPKALRASMGSIFRVAMHYVEDFEGAVKQHAGKILVADMAGTDANRADYPTRTYILLGNEAKGVSAAIKAIPGLETVTIPRVGHAESLNAAVSGGILAALAAASDR